MADERRRARPVPTVLALLAFVPLGALLWWALVGPRPEPALLDWAEFGYEVESGSAVALGEVAAEDSRDPALLSRRLAGLQRPLLGPLGDARQHGDGAVVALVREEADATEVTQAPGFTGIVVASSDLGEVERCAFEEPVPVAVFDEAADRLEGEVEGDVHAAIADATGRCLDGAARLAVPLVRRVVVPVGALQRLAGQRAESALLPAGVALASPEDLEVVQRYGGEDAAAMPVYAREVARQALVRTAPSNPNAELGPLGDPAYPVLARDGDALWWVMPVSPAGEGDAVAGFARTRADRVVAGALNPVRLAWLEDPLPGPALLQRRVLDVLRENGAMPADALDQVRVRWGVPDRDGRWQGHVSHAGRIRYRMLADAAGEVCIEDLDAHAVGCRGGQ